MPSHDKTLVAPRVATRTPGLRSLLEDAVRDWLRSSQIALAIVGDHCSGRSTALEYLADRFADEPIEWIDEARPPSIESLRRRAVFTVDVEQVTQLRRSECVTRSLLPWDRDDVMEWLLAFDASQCACVMARLAALGESDWTCGIPALWSIALPRMVADATIASPRDAVLGWLRARLSDDAWTRARLYALRRVFPRGTRSAMHVELHGVDAEAERVLDLTPVFHELAAEVVARDVANDRVRPSIRRRCPSRDVVEKAAVALRTNEELFERVRTQPPRNPDLGPVANSVMIRVDPEWRPTRESCEWLHDALLEHASWSGVDLSRSALYGAKFDFADLSGADLSTTYAREASFRRAELSEARFGQSDLVNASFHDADARRANFEGAMLVYAALRRARCDGASFASAYLMRADLSDGSFVRANMLSADLTGAEIRGADFRGCNFAHAVLAALDLRHANLHGASFSMADLERVVLDHVRLEAPNFGGADLQRSTWTGARTPRAILRDANLAGAGLADVDWQGADLRNADLHGASFHLGSSRSGLVPGGIASEGTRTGFYTDEYCEQTFRAPEEIRKANLRFADLRGAKVEDCDFYLVDLRGAIFSSGQRRHFERANAIL